MQLRNSLYMLDSKISDRYTCSGDDVNNIHNLSTYNMINLIEMLIPEQDSFAFDIGALETQVHSVNSWMDLI